MRRRYRTALASLTCLAAGPSLAARSGTVPIGLTMNASRPIGDLKPLTGANGAPDLSFLPSALRDIPFKPLHDVSAG